MSWRPLTSPLALESISVSKTGSNRPKIQVILGILWFLGFLILGVFNVFFVVLGVFNSSKEANFYSRTLSNTFWHFQIWTLESLIDYRNISTKVRTYGNVLFKSSFCKSGDLNVDIF